VWTDFSGRYDPLIQYQAYYNFTVNPGNTYDVNIYTPAQAATVYASLYGAGNCTDQLKQCKATGDNTICSRADNYCANNIEGPYDSISGRDEYDVRELTPDRFPYSFYTSYLNTPKVQQAIGAYVNFSSSNSAVSQDFGLTGDDGREDNTIEDVQTLLQDGVAVAMYAGDADYNCNWLGGQAVAEEVAGNGFQFGWAAAGFQNITTSDNIVHGQVRQSGKFSFSRIYLSGHEVPFYQPLVALQLFSRVITGRDVATGLSIVGKCYRTVGSKQSTYREGNSTVQYKVVPANTTYNVNTGAPGGPWGATPARRR
jgi:carboxypeptidase C (cathepsin A)